MKSSKIINELFKIIQSIKKNKKLNTEFSLREDLNFDSFDLARLTVKIEDKFKIDIFKGRHPRKIKDIIKKISK